MPSAANGFSLGAMLFFKTVYGNDVPRPILLQIAYPGQVGCVAGETVGQMYNCFHFRFCSRQLPDAVRQVRRQIIIEKEFQAASLSSNSTASLTIFGVMSNTRATIEASRPSAR